MTTTKNTKEVILAVATYVAVALVLGYALYHKMFLI